MKDKKHTLSQLIKGRLILQVCYEYVVRTLKHQSPNLDTSCFPPTLTQTLQVRYSKKALRELLSLQDNRFLFPF